MAKADPAESVNVMIADSAIALEMIFIGISPVSSVMHRCTSEANFGGATPINRRPGADQAPTRHRSDGNDFRTRVRATAFLTG